MPELTAVITEIVVVDTGMKAKPIYVVVPISAPIPYNKKLLVDARHTMRKGQQLQVPGGMAVRLLCSDDYRLDIIGSKVGSGTTWTLIDGICKAGGVKQDTNKYVTYVGAGITYDIMPSGVINPIDPRQMPTDPYELDLSLIGEFTGDMSAPSPEEILQNLVQLHRALTEEIAIPDLGILREAEILSELATLSATLGRPSDTITYYERASLILRESGDLVGSAAIQEKISRVKSQYNL